MDVFHYGVSVQCEWCKYQLWMCFIMVSVFSVNDVSISCGQCKCSLRMMCFIMVSVFSVNDVSISCGQCKCSLRMMCFIMVSVFNVSDVSVVDDVFHYGVSVQCELCINCG